MRASVAANHALLQRDGQSDRRTHEIMPINAQAVVGEGSVKGQAKRKHQRLTN